MGDLTNKEFEFMSAAIKTMPPSEYNKLSELLVKFIKTYVGHDKLHWQYVQDTIKMGIETIDDYGRHNGLICHCGRDIYVDTNNDNFTRHMCEWCTDSRCDIPNEDEIYDCVNQKVMNHAEFMSNAKARHEQDIAKLKARWNGWSPHGSQGKHGL